MKRVVGYIIFSLIIVILAEWSAAIEIVRGIKIWVQRKRLLNIGEN